MATPPTDLSHLDTETLRRFTDTDVAGFVKLLTDLMADTPQHETPSMNTLANQFLSAETGYVKTPLKVGRLGASDGSAGPLSAAPFLACLASAAKSLNGIEEDQLTLFRDIKRELGTVVTDMEKTQKDSLDEIESQKFLNDLHAVNADLAPSKQT
ncbi:type VII secretion system-associated protein [Streptomyces sp. NPDC052299]|uniref:type VII secretion system-associated protein n=1 Tax=Streptomyces sp. NPDC052299 TaxID=3155054 RepID=UPI003438FAFF